ncbi:uncharacterized protein LOC136083291 [Hydra vulgaris]|uniref:Uncharacterized protein LOC136083291 n=1 Tax=Hydra vulgaris TaxID=6087 RepID=A0ABM4CAR6_HYDVU
MFPRKYPSGSSKRSKKPKCMSLDKFVVRSAPDEEIAPHEEIALHEENANHEERVPHKENPPVEEITVEKEITLEEINKVNKTLLSYSCDLSTIVPLWDSLIEFVQNAREKFEKFEIEAQEVYKVEISYTASRKRRIPKSKTLDESQFEDAALARNGRQSFICDIFNVICDNLKSHLCRRKKVCSGLETRFGFLSCAKAQLQTPVVEASEKFGELYEKDVDDDFKDEYLHFTIFVPNINNPNEMLQLIKDIGISHTFPNVETALRIFLSITVSNCSGERSFSTLKRIKNRLRSSMSSERLSGLALMSIESEVTKRLDFEEILNEFMYQKSRKKIY